MRCTKFKIYNNLAHVLPQKAHQTQAYITYSIGPLPFKRSRAAETFPQMILWHPIRVRLYRIPQLQHTYMIHNRQITIAASVAKLITHESDFPFPPISLSVGKHTNISFHTEKLDYFIRESFLWAK